MSSVPEQIRRETASSVELTAPVSVRQSNDLRLRRFFRESLPYILENRIWLLAIGHALLFTISYWVAFLLRFDFSIPATNIGRFWGTLPAILAIKLYVFYVTGHFHGWWRYVTFSDLVALLRATAICLLTLVLLNHYALEGHVPRAVVVICLLYTSPSPRDA